MNEIEDKIKVLSMIARKLNQANITWCIGASLLLYLKGIVDNFNDIDIMVVYEDREKLKEIMNELGKLEPSLYSSQYKTRCFLEYSVENVDIDIMAGFIIVKDGIEYDCSLEKDQICETVMVKGQTIPLQSLSRWKYYYKLMNRDNKVLMLKNIPDEIEKNIQNQIHFI